jgi:ABC-2 type transport system ATP-binding protein
MSIIIDVNHVVKTYARPIRSGGIAGGIRDLFFKKYNYVNAVDDISLKVMKGEFIGYIGPNGAGKSTSIKILTGILQASSGSIKVLGLDPFKNRKDYTRQIGVVFGQRTQLWWDIAVKESYYLLRRIYQVPEREFIKRLDDLVAMFEISGLLDTPVRKLSLGERMKCDIVASLLHKPSVLFLDEPTIGLDAVAKESIREFLKTLHSMGETTILLTTHDLQEIEELCSRIVVLDHGKIVYDGNLEKIKHLAGLSRRLGLDWDPAAVTDIGSARDTVSSLSGVLKVETKGRNGLMVEFDPDVIPVPALLEKLGKIHPLRDLQVSEPGIEEVIRKLYRRGFTGSV